MTCVVRAYRRDLARDPERSLRRRTRGVFSKKSARRGLMILARGSKNWGRERGGKREGRVEGIRPGRERKKKASRSNLYLSSFRTHTRTPRRAYACAVACRWLRLSGRTRMRMCVSTREGETRTSRRNVQCENAPWYRSK